MAETIAPRLLHNQTLYHSFMQQHRIKSTVPPVFQQHESVVINRHALYPFCYNPSIIRFQGHLLMTCRWHSTGTPATQLCIAELDEKFNVKTNQEIQLSGPSTSAEDGKLFVFRDHLYLGYVESRWPMAFKSVVKYGLLVESPTWKVVDTKQPAIGKNDGSSVEKNWVFFEHEDGLLCIYKSQPQITFSIAGDQASAEYLCDGPQWNWGPIKGGCVIPHDGKLLRFFHSTLDYDLPPDLRRYYLGACLMETIAPFQVTAISRKPIAIGSEQCDMNDPQRNECGHYKPKVIFPGGVIQGKDGWLLAVGTNDSGCVLLKLKTADLNL